MTLTSDHPDTTEALATALAAAIDGTVHRRDDADITSLVTGFNVAMTYQPELVVLAHTAADVAGAVAVAAQHRRTVAVQATGHGASPAGPGTVLILTGRLTFSDIDPAARTAHPGAGARRQQVSYTVIGVLAPPLAAEVPQALEVALAASASWSTGECLTNVSGGADDIASDRVRRSVSEPTLELLVRLHRSTDPGGELAPASRWAVPGTTGTAATC